MKKTKMFGNEKFSFVKCCYGNHDLKVTEQRLRDEGFIIRWEFVHGKYYVYSKPKQQHKNYWGTTAFYWDRNPHVRKQEQAIRALTLDTDKDGKHDWEDCRPLDPKKQDVEGEFATPKGKIEFRVRRRKPGELFIYKDSTGKELFREHRTDKPKPLFDLIGNESEEKERGFSKIIESGKIHHHCLKCDTNWMSHNEVNECPFCGSSDVEQKP